MESTDYDETLEVLVAAMRNIYMTGTSAVQEETSHTSTGLPSLANAFAARGPAIREIAASLNVCNEIRVNGRGRPYAVST